MQVSIGNLAPRAVVVGLVAFGVWPTVTQFLADEKPKPPEAMPELAAALLSPKPLPLPTRDPFGMLTVAKPSVAQNPARPDAARQLSLSALAAAKNAGRGDGKVATKPVDPLSGLTLTGTCIMGDQRLAVINGHLYAPQETLATVQPAASKPMTNKSTANKSAPDKSAPSPYEVVDVLPYKVLLAHDGQILELVYSNVASGSASKGTKGRAGGAKTSRGGSSGRSKKTGK
jgi:hypothetical protein